MRTIDMNAWNIDGGARGRHHHGRGGPDQDHAQGRGLGPRSAGERGGRGFGGRGSGGPGGPGGRGPGGRGGRPRGDVRVAVLVLLGEQPRHGYDLIRAIEERTSGAWSPSPGSIYPTLQALEDEGLVVIDRIDGRKVASLTEAGRGWLQDGVADADAVFAGSTGDDAAGQVRQELMQLRDAAIHVTRQLRSEDDARKVAEILAAARTDLYRLLTDRA